MPSKRVKHRYCKDCGVKFKPTTNAQELRGKYATNDRPN